MKDESCPAYPCEGIYLEIDPQDMKEKYSGVHFENPGMSLRDYFAGQALAGLAVGYNELSGSLAECNGGITSAAYGIADAMLRERAKS